MTAGKGNEGQAAMDEAAKEQVAVPLDPHDPTQRDPHAWATRLAASFRKMGRK